MFELWDNYTLRTIALGTAVLGAVSGALGCFAVLRKQSLLGDAISHAALPGVMVAFLLTRGLTDEAWRPLALLAGAAVAGWLGTLAVMGIVRSSPLHFDAALGLVLSVFFGLGLALLTSIQRLPDASQAGLEKKYLFGQAAMLLERDVAIVAGLGGAALLVALLFWKEFKLLAFDPDFAASLGFSVRLLDVLVTTLLVVAIVIGLETVGAVLMSAMVVAPAAAARQWTDRLGRMMSLAALFGAGGGVGGALLSYHHDLPTGPAVVLTLSGVVLLSLALAPNRGLAWEAVRHLRNRRRLRVEAVLEDLYALAAQHERPHGHPVGVLEAMSAEPDSVRGSLRALAARGWAVRMPDGGWALTPEGRAAAEERFAGSLPPWNGEKERRGGTP
jgi:manganese/zinc/iron transport system permease protein